jgi:hypothetical protein
MTDREGTDKRGRLGEQPQSDQALSRLLLELGALALLVLAIAAAIFFIRYSAWKFAETRGDELTDGG